MISAPLDTSHKERLSHEQEELLVLEAFSELIQTGRVEIDFTDNGTLQALEEKLRRNHYHILHFSGHGGFREQNQQGYLVLEDPLTLNQAAVSGREFAEAV